jgi:molybdate transport system substrate-binding protein
MWNLSKLTLILLFLPLVISCSSNEIKVQVMAASSLTEAFKDMVLAFETENPGVDVQLDFGGSQRLRSQIEFGAKADIFASADYWQMEQLVSAGLIDGRWIDFTANSLVLITPNDSLVNAVPDLALPGVRLVLAQKNVPAGAYSLQLLTNLSQDGSSFKGDVLRNSVSEEPNVRNVAQKVALGEVDAGIVYRTDVPAAKQEGDIYVIEFPEELNVSARYPMAVLKEASEREIAQRFMTFVLSDAGQRILGDHGFGSP